ncbi:hypothetical protein Bbelb_133040 [Branchiostoma belcheri]|nr:hypothetical protein Bbelb_133040 [Branchiostoma belcheri]
MSTGISLTHIYAYISGTLKTCLPQMYGTAAALQTWCHDKFLQSENTSSTSCSNVVCAARHAYTGLGRGQELEYSHKLTEMDLSPVADEADGTRTKPWLTSILPMT